MGIGAKAVGAFHFANDDANYRDVGQAQAFNEEMVDCSLEGLRQCLKAASDHKQQRLQHKAQASALWATWTGAVPPAEAGPGPDQAATPSAWQRLNTWWYR